MANNPADFNPSRDSANSSGDNEVLTYTDIALITLGVFAGILIIVAIILLLCGCKSKKREAEPPVTTNLNESPAVIDNIYTTEKYLPRQSQTAPTGTNPSAAPSTSAPVTSTQPRQARRPLPIPEEDVNLDSLAAQTGEGPALPPRNNPVIARPGPGHVSNDIGVPPIPARESTVRPHVVTTQDNSSSCSRAPLPSTSTAGRSNNNRNTCPAPPLPSRPSAMRSRDRANTNPSRLHIFRREGSSNPQAYPMQAVSTDRSRVDLGNTSSAPQLPKRNNVTPGSETNTLFPVPIRNTTSGSNITRNTIQSPPLPIRQHVTSTRSYNISRETDRRGERLPRNTARSREAPPVSTTNCNHSIEFSGTNSIPTAGERVRANNMPDEHAQLSNDHGAPQRPHTAAETGSHNDNYVLMEQPYDDAMSLRREQGSNHFLQDFGINHNREMNGTTGSISEETLDTNMPMGMHERAGSLSDTDNWADETAVSVSDTEHGVDGTAGSISDTEHGVDGTAGSIGDNDHVADETAGSISDTEHRVDGTAGSISESDDRVDQTVAHTSISKGNRIIV